MCGLKYSLKGTFILALVKLVCSNCTFSKSASLANLAMKRVPVYRHIKSHIIVIFWNSDGYLRHVCAQ